MAKEAHDTLHTIKTLARNKPAIERPQSTIDLDKERGQVRGGKQKRRPLSVAQTRKLRLAYFVHLLENDRWRRTRRLVVYKTVKDDVKARWSPPQPRVPWEELVHSEKFGVYATTIKQAKAWMHKFGKELRAEIRAGVYQGKLPDWAVRQLPARHEDPALGPARALSVPRLARLRRPAARTSGSRCHRATSGTSRRHDPDSSPSRTSHCIR